MKTTILITLILIAVIINIKSQTIQAGTHNSSTVPAPTPYAVVSRDANSAIWQYETYEQAADGSIVPRVHKYTELATGLNHWVNGQWVASKEEIDVSPDGSSAAATNGQHQVYFPGNIYSGIIRLVTPEGKTLRSQPVGLSYSDGSNSVLLAEVTNSTGAILSTGNQVIYTNAFAGINADLLYTYSKAGFEQDVILRQQPPDPAALGLDPQATRLQVVTEFFKPPQPGFTARSVPTGAGNLEDDSLSFGAMQMRRGKAFSVGTKSVSAAVTKRWLIIQGRKFLIEEVPIVSVAGAIDSLPPFAWRGHGLKPVVSKNLILPSERPTHTSPKTMFVVQTEAHSRGLVLDWAMTLTSQTNYTFQGDTTYYISGVVNLEGTNTFEGGTSLKYASNATVNIVGINCKTAPYRPVYFTAKDDDRTGDWVNGTTHNPTGFYANPALNITASGQTLSNFHIAYAQEAVSFIGGSENFYNGQIVNCQNGFSASYADVLLRNILFAGVQTDFNNLQSVSVDAQNTTFYNSLLANANSAGLTCTNCIFAYVGNYYNLTLNGAYNGFVSSPQFGSQQVATNSFPFQTVGAGGYYLTNGCVFHGAGTTNIDPTLLTNLAELTTYSPILYSNVPITILTFSVQAQRDTNATPDLGYHYPPIDYFFGGCTAASNITFTAGTAAGWFEAASSAGPNAGITLQTQVTAAFQGTVTAPCTWARYDTVQDGGNGLWLTKGWLGGIASSQNNSYSNSLAAQVVLNFTHCAEMWGDPNHFRDYYTPLIVIAQNSEFWSGYLAGYNNSAFLTNCLLDRMPAGQDQGYNSSNAFVMRNCTWHGGQVYFTPNYNPIQLSIHDCTLDGTTIVQQNFGTNGDYDYNAYTNGAPQLANSGSHDITVASYNWQSSWFGNFYLPPNSLLIDAGDVPASQVGLYHFTTQTNQVPETNSPVDIGYHYVATDTNGVPLDSNGNGIPDYIEDANGKGQPLAITLLAPANNSYFIEPATIPMQATVFDWSGTVTNVEFFKGSVGLAGVASAPYNYSWPAVAAGSYTVMAQAYDNKGATAQSTPSITVTVTNLCSH